jgi:hypothetical protein
MKFLPYAHHQLQVAAKLTTVDIQKIQQRRRAHNRLGFAYQLVFARLVFAKALLVDVHGVYQIPSTVMILACRR